MDKDKNSTEDRKKLTLGSHKLSLNKKNMLSSRLISSDSKDKMVIKIAKKVQESKDIDFYNKNKITDIEAEKNDLGVLALHRAQLAKKNITSSDETSNKDKNILELDYLNKHESTILGKKSILITEDSNSITKTDIDTPKEIDNQNLPSNDKIQHNKDISEPPIEASGKTAKSQKLLDSNSLADELIVQDKIKTKTKKLKKSHIINMIDEESGDLVEKPKSISKYIRRKAKLRNKNQVNPNYKPSKIYREVIIPEQITVSDLADRMSELSADLIKELLKLGITADNNYVLNAETAELIVLTFKHKPKIVLSSDIENILIEEKDNENDLIPRAPIVTVMGHVDHGKTSLLDALKSTNVASSESGGITQHIGAYTVELADNKVITFIDTPGHEAFTDMRLKGSLATDIVVLVIASDDTVRPQTIEAINHAKSANVPIIVAINKIDKDNANIEHIKTELLNYEVISEDYGGDILMIPVSAIKRINLDKLEEAILMLAEIQELKANPSTIASGVVIESRMDEKTGISSTLVVQRGTLKKGDIVLAGQSYGRIKNIKNDKNTVIKSVTPSLVCEVFGLNTLPDAGDKFNVVKTEKQARDIIAYRSKQKNITTPPVHKIDNSSDINQLFIQTAFNKKVKILPIILKVDVNGSLNAMKYCINNINTPGIEIKILYANVGPINSSDITFASVSKAIIIGFNVKTNTEALMKATQYNIKIVDSPIIYRLIDELKSVISEMLDPIKSEKYLGRAKIIEVFTISKIGKIAGSYIIDGVIKLNSKIKILHNNTVLHEDTIIGLKHFKEDVKEVKSGMECGIFLKNTHDFTIGDIIEAVEVIETRAVIE
ncbi:translation initiation factor IF-2 [Rickettsia endosymbiont of Cardiosporidium cionae]|uniref:translation initiation factor IF-2 n=1 Tax=Rickettsia endosymbiont of Cardiosporidium cionae TaxID=2777155 RepID=UPI001895432A|nr:translation initiation factor IF-2 [Rickettsia endosymbiont of Cardiosporidium cionae]KAF8818910.1 Translation initiation factor IF-2 [Rickettsia endosymbiont of Cardiosporidium cionae]